MFVVIWMRLQQNLDSVQRCNCGLWTHAGHTCKITERTKGVKMKWSFVNLKNEIHCPENQNRKFNAVILKKNDFTSVSPILLNSKFTFGNSNETVFVARISYIDYSWKCPWKVMSSDLIALVLYKLNKAWKNYSSKCCKANWSSNCCKGYFGAIKN